MSMIDTLMAHDSGGRPRVHRAAWPGADARPAEPSATPGAGKPAESESLGFFDLLDIVNPLQHIPGVSTVYRELTGDEISAPARMVGGAIYLGPIGFVASAVNAVFEAVTGRDVGETVMAVFRPEEGPAEPEVQLADAGTPEPPAGAALASAAAVAAQPRAAQPSLTLPESAPPAPAAGHNLFLASARADEPAAKPEPAAAPPASPADRGPLFEKLAKQGRLVNRMADRVSTTHPQPRPEQAAREDGPAQPESGFYAAMMDGLRKYEQMHGQHQAEGLAETGGRLDASF